MKVFKRTYLGGLVGITRPRSKHGQVYGYRRLFGRMWVPCLHRRLVLVESYGPGHRLRECAKCGARYEFDHTAEPKVRRVR